MPGRAWHGKDGGGAKAKVKVKGTVKGEKGQKGQVQECVCQRGGSSYNGSALTRSSDEGSGSWYVVKGKNRVHNMISNHPHTYCEPNRELYK
jgi:hypothetical protein